MIQIHAFLLCLLCGFLGLFLGILIGIGCERRS